MTFEEFSQSLSGQTAPPPLTPILQALWYDGKGNWEKAHAIAQQANTPDYCWIHAYLHRKEGDAWNANYWYNRAGRKMPDTTLTDEWADMVRTLL